MYFMYVSYLLLLDVLQTELSNTMLLSIVVTMHSAKN
jgi:hypothetical protein